MNGERLDRYKQLAAIESRNFSSQTRFLIEKWMTQKEEELAKVTL